MAARADLLWARRWPRHCRRARSSSRCGTSSRSSNFAGDAGEPLPCDDRRKRHGRDPVARRHRAARQPHPHRDLRRLRELRVSPQRGRRPRGQAGVDGSRRLLRPQDEAHRLARGDLRDPAAQGLRQDRQPTNTGRLPRDRLADRHPPDLRVLRPRLRDHGLLGRQAPQGARRAARRSMATPVDVEPFDPDAV